MQINNKKNKDRLSRLQWIILQVLSTGKYEHTHMPLNEKRRGWYATNDGNISELREQVSKAYGDGVDKVLIGDYTIHKYTKNFSVSFSRAIRSLQRKGLVVIYYYHELPALKWRQHKLCAGKEPIDRTPCEGCPMLKAHIECGSFFVSNTEKKCYALLVYKSESRVRVKELQRPTIFSVFLTENGIKLAQLPKPKLSLILH